MKASRPAPPDHAPGLDGGLDHEDRKELAHRADRELARRGGAGSLVYAGIALLVILVSSFEGTPSLLLYVELRTRLEGGDARGERGPPRVQKLLRRVQVESA